MQRSPSQAIDMIDVYLFSQQPPHNARIASVSGPYQRRPVETVLVVDPGSVGDRQVQQPRIVPDLGCGDQVGALDGLVLGIHIGAGGDQEPGNPQVVAVCRRHQRRAALIVPGVNGGSAQMCPPHRRQVTAS